jgi:hypothetical protein
VVFLWRMSLLDGEEDRVRLERQFQGGDEF